MADIEDLSPTEIIFNVREKYMYGSAHTHACKKDNPFKKRLMHDAVLS